MKLQVLHRTRYAYATPVRDNVNEVRLRPPDTAGQTRHSFVLKVLPATKLTHYLDFYLNCVHVFDIAEPHSELSVEATSVVTTGGAPLLAPGATPFPLAEIGPACARLSECYDFLSASRFVSLDPAAWRLALDLAAGQTDVWQTALAIMRHIHAEFEYQPASTHVFTPMSEALQLRRGVCQDFAHVMIGLCRSLKIPARYVSGYLYNGPVDQLKGAQASHAWVEVFIPGAGWLGLDPTNNRPAGEHHVKAAVGRDYADISPLRGNYWGTNQYTFTVEVLVSRLDDADEARPAAASSQHQTQSSVA
jgi:transglutaminase-like putative cysteine protease